MIDMIGTLAADIDTLAPESATAVADSVSQILIAGLSALPAARRAPVSQLTALHREQIKALVRERLRDPTSAWPRSPRGCGCRRARCTAPGAARPARCRDWIWAQRLELARRELCDPALAARSISDIAFGCGFNDAAHFSRAFRARFGCTARELRRGAGLIDA